jgi:integrase
MTWFSRHDAAGSKHWLPVALLACDPRPGDADALLVNEKGERLTAAMLRNRFDDARDAAGIDKALFQFRDLRAKAATETDDASGTRGAQALLGHTTESMTASYIRHKVGRKVKLLR